MDGQIERKDVILTEQKIEPGKTHKLREFFESEQEGVDDVKETNEEILGEDDVILESAFIFSREDGDYLQYYVEAEDFEKTIKKFKSSNHEVVVDFRDLVEDVLVGGWEAYHERRVSAILHLKSGGS